MIDTALVAKMFLDFSSLIVAMSCRWLCTASRESHYPNCCLYQEAILRLVVGESNQCPRDNRCQLRLLVLDVVCVYKSAWDKRIGQDEVSVTNMKHSM